MLRLRNLSSMEQEDLHEVINLSIKSFEYLIGHKDERLYHGAQLFRI
jgi:hypothetical protein